MGTLYKYDRRDGFVVAQFAEGTPEFMAETDRISRHLGWQLWTLREHLRAWKDVTTAGFLYRMYEEL